MILRRMKRHNVASLDELARSYKELGGKTIACTMTMELMGISKGDLREDLVTEYGTVGKYCYVSKDATITLFKKQIPIANTRRHKSIYSNFAQIEKFIPIVVIDQRL